MRHLALIVALAACKQRATIDVKIAEPCGVAADMVGVYLVRGIGCAEVRCGLPGFTCEDLNCHTPCLHDGYCTIDELDTLEIDAGAGGDYALVLSYRYPGAVTDEGIVCYAVSLDDDGVHPKSIATDDLSLCCMGSGSGS